MSANSGLIAAIILILAAATTGFFSGLDWPRTAASKNTEPNYATKSYLALRSDARNICALRDAENAEYYFNPSSVYLNTVALELAAKQTYIKDQQYYEQRYAGLALPLNDMTGAVC